MKIDLSKIANEVLSLVMRSFRDSLEKGLYDAFKAGAEYASKEGEGWNETDEEAFLEWRQEYADKVSGRAPVQEAPNDKR